MEREHPNRHPVSPRRGHGPQSACRGGRRPENADRGLGPPGPGPGLPSPRKCRVQLPDVRLGIGSIGAGSRAGGALCGCDQPGGRRGAGGIGRGSRRVGPRRSSASTPCPRSCGPESSEGYTPSGSHSRPGLRLLEIREVGWGIEGNWPMAQAAASAFFQTLTRWTRRRCQRRARRSHMQNAGAGVIVVAFLRSAAYAARVGWSSPFRRGGVLEVSNAPPTPVLTCANGV